MVIVFAPKTWGCGSPSKWPCPSWLVNGDDPINTYKSWDDFFKHPLKKYMKLYPSYKSAWNKSLKLGL